MKFYEAPKCSICAINSEDIMNTSPLSNGGNGGNPMSTPWDNGESI